MRVGSKAVSGGDPPSDGLQSGHAKVSLHPYPGEEFHRHDGTQWKERSETVLTKLGLLIVANGDDPAACKTIIDLDLLPELASNNRHYESRIEYNAKITAENLRKEEQRFQLRLEAWTSLYSLCKECTEQTAPMLSKELKKLCDLANAGYAGQFDGPRAYNTLVHYINSGPRSKEDKTFYRTAEYIQRTKVLPNG
eukprot:5322433-Prymnesium_polylepis.1